MAAVYGDGTDVVQRVLRFALAGGANTLFDLWRFALALPRTSLGAVQVGITAWLTYLAGGGFGWVLGRTWTFPGRLAHAWRRALWMVALGALNGALTGRFSLGHGPTLAGKAVALVVTGAVSFVVQSAWVFVQRKTIVRGGLAS
ncbi:MAG: GtrA family protein [Firmicutes bacterium]|nr:GtrA family protein [Bacillota bacterium]